MYLRALNEKSSLIEHPQYRLLISRLHEAGPRPVGEFIAELHRLHPELSVMDLLERYARIDVTALRQVGADRWPVSIFAVGNVRSGSATRADILRATLPPPEDGDAA